ncbi:MAG: potassium channel family protein [Patescibacteria group bacterium]|jgi:voltage-gated potassium channel
MKRKSSSVIFITLFLSAVLIGVGAWFFRLSEGWNWIDSFYFTVMTVTTVGYGDLVPTHDFGKILTSIYGLVSIPVMLYVFSVIVGNNVDSRIGHLERKMREIIAREEEIEEIIEDGAVNMKKKRASFFRRLLRLE